MSEPPFLLEHFQRQDEREDGIFYSVTRLATHIDDGAIAAVSQLYAELLPANGSILDVASSWKSHLPNGVAYGRVVGLGMNEEELGENDQLSEWVVHDLNREPRLPFDGDTFDAAAMCVSAQYLTQPVEVFRDVGRVLRDGAPFIVTFSNLIFPEKAVAIWLSCNMEERSRLIGAYFHYAGRWDEFTAQERRPQSEGDPLFTVWARKRVNGAEDGL